MTVYREAIERYLAAVEPPAECAPLVAAVRGLSSRLDEDDGDAAMWREFRFLLRDLRGEVGGGIGDTLEAEFASLDG